MRKLKFFSILCISILLAGCASSAEEREPLQDSKVRIGNYISIDPPQQLRLLESSETLAADGLYYATWTDGSPVPYENSDGETAELYDAQLYFLASESPDEEAAQKDCAAWLSAAKETYDVYSEETITRHGQTYTLISYNFTGDNTPYHHGTSAFAAHGVSAVCVEFTCLKNYDKELEPILMEFLDGCAFTDA